MPPSSLRPSPVNIFKHFCRRSHLFCEAIFPEYGGLGTKMFNDIGHKTKVAVMPIFGRNSKHIFFSIPDRPMNLNFHTPLQLCALGFYRPSGNTTSAIRSVWVESPTFENRLTEGTLDWPVLVWFPILEEKRYFYKIIIEITWLNKNGEALYFSNFLVWIGVSGVCLTTANSWLNTCFWQ